MEREGQHHLFTKLCREWESLAISAGTRSLLRQWFLEAAEPQNVGGQPLLDICFAKLLTEGAEAELSEPTRRDGLAKEAAGGTGPGQSGVSHLQPGASPPPQPAIPGQHRFRRVPGLGLPPELSWIDPVGVGPPDLQPGRPLILTPPLFLDLWPPSNVDAPRLMLSLEGEFVAETFVEVGEQSAALSGLLLWHSERDFVRLERVRSPSHGNGITLEGSVSGSYLHLGRGRFTAPGVWLRLERTGPNVRGLCSQDRKQWWTCGTAPFPSDGRAQVGLACVAHAAGATASFERFTVWKR